MHFNPCGAAVDVIRGPFTTEVRPFFDSDLVVKQRWFRVDKDTYCLPFPTIFNNRAWENEAYQTGDLGEIDNPYRKFDRRPAPLLVGLDHICGTPAMFLRGESVDSPLPPTEYAADGLPLCCRPELPDPLILDGVSDLVRPDEIVLGGEGWYCDGYTAIWDGPITIVLAPVPVVAQPQFWRSVDAEVNLWAPGQFPFTGSNDWLLYSATSPFFNTRWTTTDWDGHGCRIFNRSTGTGPLTVEVCCG